MTTNDQKSEIIKIYTTGKRMSHDDPLFAGFMVALNRTIIHVTKMGILGFVPWLVKILPRSWLGLDNAEKYIKEVEEYFKVPLAQTRDELPVGYFI